MNAARIRKPGRLSALCRMGIGVGVVWLAVAPVADAQDAAADRLARLQRDVKTLVDPQWEGRDILSPGLAAAAQWLRNEFETIGLQPLTDDFAQIVPIAQGTGMNVLGLVAGTNSPEAKPEAKPETSHVIVAAHYDGQGKNRVDGNVFPSADDNASGVAALLELARWFVQNPPERSVLFVAFTGEESGFLGSRAYVGAPVLPLEQCVAMLNLDTVGRVENDRFTVFGVGTAGDWADMLAGVNYAVGFQLDLVKKGSNASDDVPFVEHGVPALHLFSGANADYHQPTDTHDKLNYVGLSRVVAFTAELVDYLARRDTNLRFVPPGAESAPPAAGRGKRKVSFGSIPDFSQETGGVLLSGVIPSSPAAKAGLQAGDVIVEFGGVPIDGIVDYSDAMVSFEPGEEVVVRFVRAGEEREVKVTLLARR